MNAGESGGGLRANVVHRGGEEAETNNNGGDKEMCARVYGSIAFSSAEVTSDWLAQEVSHMRSRRQANLAKQRRERVCS